MPDPVRWGIVLLIIGGLLSAMVAVSSAADASTGGPSRLASGQRLDAGQQLVSTNGRFHALVTRYGRLVVRTTAGRQLWATRPKGAGATLALRPNGQLVLTVGDEVRWRSGTRGSGRGDS